MKIHNYSIELEEKKIKEFLCKAIDRNTNIFQKKTIAKTNSKAYKNGLKCYTEFRLTVILSL